MISRPQFALWAACRAVNQGLGGSADSLGGAGAVRISGNAGLTCSARVSGLRSWQAGPSNRRYRLTDLRGVQRLELAADAASAREPLHTFKSKSFRAFSCDAFDNVAIEQTNSS